MKDKRLLYLLGAGTLTGLAGTAGAQQQRPNIIYMMADQLRADVLGYAGDGLAVTPNIDRLAAEGLRFTRFFQATARSSPTRHCLLTGLYPVRSGAYPNHTQLNDGVGTLPQYLKQAGYRVALEGKRHLSLIHI